MKRNAIHVVDVGHANAGLGGPYAACRRKLNKTFGKDRVSKGYGHGFDMDQGMYVLGASVKEIREALGERYSWVTVKRATGVKLWLAKSAFDLPRQALRM